MKYPGQRRSVMRGWRSAVAAAFCALLLGCGAALQGASAGGSERWIQVDTPHFALSTDLTELRARQLAQTLEEMRAALLTLAWSNGKAPSTRTRVIVFARPSEFDRYAGLHAATAGVAVSRPGFERLMSFSPGPQGDVPNVAVHELAHDLSHWFLPLQPPWLAEGLAVYLEQVRFDRSEQRATMGQLSGDSLEWLRASKTLMRSAKLFNNAAVHPTDPRESASYYSASWFLVHYLLNQHGAAFGQFQSRIAKLVPWRQAWQDAFPGLTNDQLDAQLLDYARLGRFVEVEEPVALAPFEPRVRVLPLADVHGVRALMAGSLGNPLAERELAEAQRLDPQQLEALVLLFHARGASQAQRKQLAERAVTAHPSKGEAWWLRALSLPSGDERLAALRRARETLPGHPGVAQLLAEELLRRGQPKQAIPEVRLALRAGALAPQTLALYVSALGAAHQCAQARSLANGAHELLHPECRLSVPDRGEIACGDYMYEAFTALGDCKEGAEQPAHSGSAGR